MLKFIFWSLVLANITLLAYSQGYLGSLSNKEHEPARMRQQLNPEKLVLMSSASASAALAAVEAAKAPPPAAPEKVSCLEAGDFTNGEAKKFEAKLAALKLGDRQSRRNTQIEEVKSHIVFIPPLGNKEAAEKKAGELRNLGVKEYFVLSDASAGQMRWAISLGVFKSEAAAQALLANLQKQGVHSARLQDRTTTATRQLFRFKDIDNTDKAKIAAIAANFDGAELRACKP